MNFDTTTSILESAIGATNKRNEVISENIANVNTPGYKRGRVEFEDQLKQAISRESISGKTTREKHIPIKGGKLHDEIDPEVVRSKTRFMRNDENNVDIDVEMAELSRNALHHNSLVRQLNSKMNRIRSVVQE